MVVVNARDARVGVSRIVTARPTHGGTGQLTGK
ncbi:unnamed protein product [Mycetohabitans rhizoxinica HKI 454]|uniref:Uncharacterized protein n=1 Tax=Mycetohabitans rhizoxinica (strain DSM 19002 / CIP 109453 / HKI 454) TaxID=882378 RepID=E5AQW5_MYCRK|nr:unnamed protein product [Mycetohabitans rhizoxinica HKI 454]